MHSCTPKYKAFHNVVSSPFFLSPEWWCIIGRLYVIVKIKHESQKGRQKNERIFYDIFFYFFNKREWFWMRELLHNGPLPSLPISFSHLIILRSVSLHKQNFQLQGAIVYIKRSTIVFFMSYMYVHCINTFSILGTTREAWDDWVGGGERVIKYVDWAIGCVASGWGWDIRIKCLTKMITSPKVIYSSYFITLKIFIILCRRWNFVENDF